MRYKGLGLATISLALISFLVPTAPIAAHPIQDSHPHQLTPRIYGGTPATGNPGVAFLGIKSSTVWDRSCSAVVWKPRILLTAAHCVTAQGTNRNVNQIAVFPPGAAVTLFRNTGPQGAAPVNVVGIWKPADYLNATTLVEPNDFAVLLLDSDLGPQFYTRLATSAEMTAWTNDLFPATLLGYGITGANQVSNIPLQTTLSVDTYEPGSRLGSVFSVGQSASSGICAGDSGGPTFATNSAGEHLALGVNSGSAGGCVVGFIGDYLMVGFAAINYLDLLNAALAGTGSPPIPSAPVGVFLNAQNSRVNVTWTPPAVSPESVVGYDVIDPAGTVVCSTAGLACSIENLPAGEYSYSVRARNAENEGDALPAVGAVEIASPRQPAPPRIRGKRIVVTTLVGQTSAVITGYRVIDAQGKRICTIRAFDESASILRCPLPKKPGTYRFRTVAETQMGQTVPSGLSRKARIS